MTNENVQLANPKDPTVNVREMIEDSSNRLDDLRKVEIRRIDEKIDATDVKYQIQFDAAKDAVNTAFIAQEKAISAALIGTKEAITKSDTTTDKRFDLLSEKIDGVIESINKSSGAQGIYVTHTDLSVEMEKLRTSFETMLRPVITFMNAQTGRSDGFNQGWLYLVGGAGIVSVIITLGVFLTGHFK